MASTWRTASAWEGCLEEVGTRILERKVMRKGIPGRGRGRADPTGRMVHIPSGNSRIRVAGTKGPSLGEWAGRAYNPSELRRLLAAWPQLRGCCEPQFPHVNAEVKAVAPRIVAEHDASSFSSNAQYRPGERCQ